MKTGSVAYQKSIMHAEGKRPVYNTSHGVIHHVVHLYNALIGLVITHHASDLVSGDSITNY